VCSAEQRLYRCRGVEAGGRGSGGRSSVARSEDFPLFPEVLRCPAEGKNASFRVLEGSLCSRGFAVNVRGISEDFNISEVFTCRNHRVCPNHGERKSPSLLCRLLLPFP